MHRTTLIFAVLFIFISLTTFAQMTAEEYNSKKGSLTLQKKELKREIEALKTEIEKLQIRIPELEQEVLTAYRELYVLKYGKEIGNQIAYKRIWKGMTDEMVRDGWGKPDRIEKNIEAWGVFTQWIYGDVIFFFQDGKLTDWQEGINK
jgi:FtsZ-binding cell division protein ZapB